MGIECEGYRRLPVFLNRTAQGWDKRQPLEEIQPQSVFGNPRDGSSVENPLTDFAFESGNRALASAVQIAPAPPTGPARIDQIIAWFWDSYSTTSMVSIRKKTEPQWIYLSLQMPIQESSLKSSVAALATVRFGRAHRNQDLIVKGRQHYGLALRDLQTSLRDPESSATDEVLAAVDFCILFEVSCSSHDCCHSPDLPTVF